MSVTKPGKALIGLTAERSEEVLHDVRCDRCGGLMSFEWFANRNDEGGYWNFQGWHCIYCGEVVDGLIISGRK